MEVLMIPSMNQQINLMRITLLKTSAEMGIHKKTFCYIRNYFKFQNKFILNSYIQSYSYLRMFIECELYRKNSKIKNSLLVSFKSIK